MFYKVHAGNNWSRVLEQRRNGSTAIKLGHESRRRRRQLSEIEGCKGAGVGIEEPKVVCAAPSAEWQECVNRPFTYNEL